MIPDFLSPSFNSSVGGTSITTGLGDIVIAAGPWGATTEWSDACYDGELVAYRRDMANEFEIGWARWNAATNTLVIDRVLESSNAGAAVNWGAGVKRVVQIADGAMLAQAKKAFPFKRAGQAIFGVGTYQSNGLGSLDTDNTMPFIQGVKVWKSDVPQTPPYGWEDADPNLASGYVTGLFTGIIGGNSGNASLTCCQWLRILCGVTVYFLGVGKSGQGVAGWADGAEVEAELSAQIAAALLSPELVAEGITTVDFVDCAMLESDRGSDPVQVAADFLAFKANMETKWATPGYTQWSLREHHPALSPSVAIALIIAQSDPLMHYISSAGKDDPADDDLHYVATQLNSFGPLLANAYMSGPQLRLPREFRTEEFAGLGVRDLRVGQYGEPESGDIQRIRTNTNIPSSNDGSVVWLYQEFSADGERFTGRLRVTAKRAGSLDMYEAIQSFVFARDTASTFYFDFNQYTESGVPGLALIPIGIFGGIVVQFQPIAGQEWDVTLDYDRQLV